jgi:hypothetical protein
MNEDREKIEQLKLNERVKMWMDTAKGVGWGLCFMASMGCAIVGFTAYLITKGHVGDLLIVIGAVGLVRLSKMGG